MELADQLREVRDAWRSLIMNDELQVVAHGDDAVAAWHRLCHAIEAVSALEAQACPSGVGAERALRYLAQVGYNYGHSDVTLKAPYRSDFGEQIDFASLRKPESATLVSLLSPSQEQQVVSEREATQEAIDRICKTVDGCKAELAASDKSLVHATVRALQSAGITLVRNLGDRPAVSDALVEEMGVAAGSVL